MSDDGEYDSELKKNSELLKTKIRTLDQELNSIRDNNYKRFWDNVKEINTSFKNTHLNIKDREELWKLHSSICEKAKKDQQKRTQESIGTIESELSLLESYSFREPYKDFWEKAKTIPDVFKNKGPIPKEERNRLWGRYQSLCERVKREQSNKYKERNRASQQKKSQVLDLINSAHFQIQGSRNMAELGKARDFLNQALEVMKNNYVGSGIIDQLINSEVRLTKKDREICWKRWTEVNNEIRFKREDHWEINYDYLISIAGRALLAARNDDLHEARRLVKEVHLLQKEKPVNDSQYQRIQSMLQEAWDIADTRFNQRRENFSRLVNEKIRHHSQQITELEGRIAHHQRQIDVCYDKIRNAYNENFIRMVQNEWIPDHESKISQLQSYLRDHESSLREWESKL